MLQTYREAERFLARVTDYEKERSRYGPREYNLRAMRAILERMGNPERAYGSIHIAGTKGKGSTAIMAERLLRAAGAHTGLFVSPHLVEMVERIQLDGVPISKREFVKDLNRVRPALKGVRPTFFEIMTAAGFEAFRRRGVDRAVVEVGLGGRLDTTNVLRPMVTVITAIDYDHMDKLGNTLARIAAEKAGILKPGVPCVVTRQHPSALRVIERVARAVGAPLIRSGRELTVRARPGKRLRVCVAFARRGRTFSMPFLGVHQAENAAAAIAAVELAWGPLQGEAIRRVFSDLVLPGRFERIGRRVLADVAHNPVSMRALAAALLRIGWRRATFVFGCSADKDACAMLDEIVPLAERILLVRAASPRAADPAALARFVPRGVPARIAGPVPAGVREALDEKGRVVVTGSFYVVGEALPLLRRQERTWDASRC